MKNEILYFYNLDALSIHQKEKNYFFACNSDKYVLKYCKNEDIINYVYNFYETYFYYVNKMHKPIQTTDNKNFIVVNGNYYLLLKINITKSKINVAELLLINSNYIYNNNSISWSKLWSDKVDFFEYQINQMGKSHERIVESFSYYIGLCENAIMLFNMINKENMILSINHKRITSNSTTYELYDPFNMMIDYRIRDICDYINSCFFNNIDAYLILDNFLRSNYLSKEEKNLFICRILYPSYYFDLYEKVIANLINENELNKILDKNKEYEQFLKYAYTKLNENNDLIEIDWIKKVMQ